MLGRSRRATGRDMQAKMMSLVSFHGIRYILTYVVISRTTCKVSLEALPTLCKPFPLKKGIMSKNNPPINAGLYYELII